MTIEQFIKGVKGQPVGTVGTVLYKRDYKEGDRIPGGMKYRYEAVFGDSRSLVAWNKDDLAILILSTLTNQAHVWVYKTFDAFITDLAAYDEFLGRGKSVVDVLKAERG